MNSILGAFQKRNVFDLTHERKFSCDMGKLIPIMVEEVIPGDTFKVHTDILVRISPLLAPVMHRINACTHFFFVPNRLIWKDWENFITGGVDGADSSIAPVIPFIGTLTAGSLADYLGLPVVNTTIAVSALPFRAYNLIYNEWFRDQNLQNKIPISLDSGTDTTTSVAVLNRNWEKDYYTSALPWPQRGPAVTVPMGGSASVTGTSSVSGTANLDVVAVDGTDKAMASETNVATVTGAGASDDSPIKAKGTVTSTGTITGIADLSSATAVTINTLRQAFQVQKWLERNARAGVRYVESILSHFGVRSSDARLQRPEFLGGGKSSVVISEVLQTSATTASGTNTPQGNMAGHAFSALKTHSFTKSFEEHGYIIGLVSLMPRTAYQQGLNRSWKRSSRYDYYWPEFAHLGEQAVLNREIYLYSGDALDDTVFGYQGRYDEYRRRESTVHGDFRTTLNFWHMGRIFDSRPNLNSDFITCVPTKRINAVTTEHNCWIQLINNVQAIRPIPLTGEPGLIDHN